MYDYLTLGATPANEDCEQLGPNYDSKRAWKECDSYRSQIIRYLKTEQCERLDKDGNSITENRFDMYRRLEANDEIRLVVKSERHEFGSYYEVNVRFDPNSQEAVEFAFWLDGKTPGEWDQEARDALGLATEEV